MLGFSALGQYAIGQFLRWASGDRESYRIICRASTPVRLTGRPSSGNPR
jgi:hypothetical protein